MHRPPATIAPTPPAFSGSELARALGRIREPLQLVRERGGQRLGVCSGPGDVGIDFELVAALPPLYPEWLGDPSFRARHGLRFPYVAGAMANGISGPELVIAMARAGFLAFYGAGGLDLPTLTAGVDTIAAALRGSRQPWGANLIHSPAEPELELATAELYVRRGVRLVSASAFMAITPAVVRYAAAGLRRLPDGRVVRAHRLLAKISRPELAARFLEPAPAPLLRELVAAERLTAAEAAIAATVPLATELIVEADSGGHTDNRPLTALFPAIAALRDRVCARHGYSEPVHVGAAGGLGTPEAVAAAFAMGASFVLTGSVNQAATESGLSAAARRLLAEADLSDVTMCAAADMFELGVKVQVLRRGTLFAARANRLYELYRRYETWPDLPAELRTELEREVFGISFEETLERTEAFWRERDPGQLERARKEPRHRMALCFRRYLGLSSHWAIAGDEGRRLDWQIWCGPSMGAFNRWARGSFLEAPEHRSVVQIARNLMEGAAVLTRAQQLRAAGLRLPSEARSFRPRPLS